MERAIPYPIYYYNCVYLKEAKMTEREKELEELTNILYANDMILLSKDSCKKQALVIQNLGYTKSHFPIEKLEERLEAFENFENSRKVQGYPKYDSTEIFVQIKKIIKELKEG
jgi:hypothetical protein